MEKLGADPRRTLSARRRRHQDYTTQNPVAASLQRAAQDRILDLRCCGLETLPDVPQDGRLWQTRILDARYNWLKSVAAAAEMDTLVLLNVAHNKVTKLPDSCGKCDLSNRFSCIHVRMLNSHSHIGVADRVSPCQ